jgi:tetratricopeptide (TPR) repeat protein
MVSLQQSRPVAAPVLQSATTTSPVTGRREWLAVVLLAAAVALTYSPVVHCEFVNHDDPVFVTENSDLRLGLSWAGLTWGLTTAYTQMLSVADSTAVAHWHPLVWWTLLLDYQLYGLQPWGFHLTNLLWHLGSTVLLYFALRRMTGAVWPSLLAAALFGVHPLNVQSVAWVAERKGVVSTFFWMLTLWCYARYAERPTWHRYVLVALSMAIGLQAKQMLVTLPCVLLLLDFWPLRRGCGARADASVEHKRLSWGWLFAEKLPLFALALAFTLLLLFQRPGAQTAPQAVPLGARLANAVHSYVAYLGQLIFPMNLAVFYPHPTLGFWETAAAASLLLALTAVALFQARQRGYLAVGWFWYLGTLLPVIGLVQLGGSARADRYVYVPLVGIFLAVSWGLAELSRHGRLVAPVVAALIVSFAARSWIQVHYWQNSRVLWQGSLEATGPNALALACLADAWKKDDSEEAVRLLDSALRLSPDYPPAHASLGLLLKDRGDLDGAIVQFESVVRVNPRYAGVHFELGQCLARKGDIDRAIRHFQEALRLTSSGEASSKANLVAIYGSLGWCWQQRGEPERSAECYRKAAELDPGSAIFPKPPDGSPLLPNAETKPES